MSGHHRWDELPRKARGGIQLVITNRMGVVHDLATPRNCAEVNRVRREQERGRERYVLVKGVQVLAFKLPGCNQCFGSSANFKEYIKIA